MRCVFQELSLCANLTVAENMTIVHPQMRGAGWGRAATEAMRAKLEAIFPGNGLTGSELVSDLTLTQQQMVEIARAFTVTDTPVRLVILDEPTSSLNAHTADQLLAFVRRAAQDGIMCLLITHMLGEIERVADRVMVMRDGAVVSVLPREQSQRASIIQAMGQHLEAEQAPGAARVSSSLLISGIEQSVRIASMRAHSDRQHVNAARPFSAHSGIAPSRRIWPSSTMRFAG